jgi:dipeptidase
MVALGNATIDGSVIFAKNSDREPNEAHMLLMIPAEEHPEDTKVKCTYIEIPQVKHTYSVLLAKPFWIWGAEMGANEHGVVIGNEAVFTKVPYQKEPGLIGMDFLRLALERSKTAKEALECITSLLERYGQGGNCGFTHDFYYHNSFLIADPGEAWVLETAGQHWAAEKVVDIRSISNRLTIGSKFDLASADLVNYAIEKGWCSTKEDFSFAGCYSDLIFSHFSDAKKRQSTTTECLRQCRGQIDISTMFDLLRNHVNAQPNWTPAKGITGSDVCMHAGFGPIRGSQTTGSMVAHLDSDFMTFWVTGTSTPCTSIFKPVWFEAGLPELGDEPAGIYQEGTLFWEHELLHREILRNYSININLLRNERNELEQNFVERSQEIKVLPVEEKLAFSQLCFSESEKLSRNWLEKVKQINSNNLLPIHYSAAWRQFNKQAKIETKLS